MINISRYFDDFEKLSKIPKIVGQNQKKKWSNLEKPKTTNIVTHFALCYIKISSVFNREEIEERSRL